MKKQKKIFKLVAYKDILASWPGYVGCLLIIGTCFTCSLGNY